MMSCPTQWDTAKLQLCAIFSLVVMVFVLLLGVVVMYLRYQKA